MIDAAMKDPMVLVMFLDGLLFVRGPWSLIYCPRSYPHAHQAELER